MRSQRVHIDITLQGGSYPFRRKLYPWRLQLLGFLNLAIIPTDRTLPRPLFFISAGPVPLLPFRALAIDIPLIFPHVSQPHHHHDASLGFRCRGPAEEAGYAEYADVNARGAGFRQLISNSGNRWSLFCGGSAHRSHSSLCSTCDAKSLWNG